jgi:hypothetical protein
VAAILVLRRLKGWERKSSAIEGQDVDGGIQLDFSSCLRECRALKLGTPSTPRMTASPSTNQSAQHRGQREEFCKRLRRDRKQPD